MHVWGWCHVLVADGTMCIAPCELAACDGAQSMSGDASRDTPTNTWVIQLSREVVLETHMIRHGKPQGYSIQRVLVTWIPARLANQPTAVPSMQVAVTSDNPFAYCTPEQLTVGAASCLPGLYKLRYTSE